MMFEKFFSVSNIIETKMAMGTIMWWTKFENYSGSMGSALM